ncbi:MAG: SH3 domain-containing protein, partial [Pseudomonas sp.]
MKRIVMTLALLVASLATAPSALAQARTGYAVTHANLRAGPDSGYPRIGTVPAGAALDIYGCIDDWSWCDVQWRGERGWISAGLIEYEYSGRRVDVYDYGAQIGLPILVFALDTYWGSHYRGRSWYRERDRWRDHRPSPRPVARPADRPRAQPAPSPRREEPSRQ